MTALRKMEVGQVVDYCTEWNRIHSEDGTDEDGKKKKGKVKKRKATQADWDAFLG